MRELVYHDIKVRFPYEPYPAQDSYMSKCIEALKSGCHAILESPTGTGKTLCLLASVLAFREHFFAEMKKCVQSGVKGAHMGHVPKIIYSSRTHSQLTQVVAELKKLNTVCGYSIDMSVVGGRGATCLNPKVSKIADGRLQQNTCSTLCKAKKCHWFNTLDSMSEEALPGGILDIEDLVNWSTKKVSCAYYLGRRLAEKAEITLLPYNYLLDPRLRTRHKLEVANKILIFDEAHNVEGVAEDAASFELTSTEIALAMEECKVCLELIDDINKMDVPDESKDYYLKKHHNPMEGDMKGATSIREMEERAGILVQALYLLEENLEKAYAGEVRSSKEGKTFAVSSLDNVLNETGFTSEAFFDLKHFVPQLATFVSEKSPTKGMKLNRVLDFVEIFSMIEPQKQEAEFAKYRLFIKTEDSKFKREKDEQFVQEAEQKKGMKICLWCFDPSKSITHLLDQGAKSIILTSGTLSPIEEYASNLGLDRHNSRLPVTLVNKHVVARDQVFVATVPKGIGNNPLDMMNVYSNRQNRAMFTQMGQIIAGAKASSPGGLLVFHPTYRLMNICRDYWGIMNGANASNPSGNMFKRKIFIEPSNKNDLEQVNKDYETAIIENAFEGGILMGVCRGKISEGVDFADARGRVVIITGIPYAPAMDPKVKMKREYIDIAFREKRSVISGNEWYQIQAARAINQAIGRIIRHKNDFGAIIYLDKRFADPKMQKYMPSWVKCNHQTIMAHEVSGKLRTFFNKMASYQRAGKITPEAPIVLVQDKKKSAKILSRREERRKAEEARIFKDNSSKNREMMKMMQLIEKEESEGMAKAHEKEEKEIEAEFLRRSLGDLSDEEDIYKADGYLKEQAKNLKRTFGDLSDDENDVEPEPKKPQMTPEEFEELISKPFIEGHYPLSRYQNKEKSLTYEQLVQRQKKDWRGHPNRRNRTEADVREENRQLAIYDFYEGPVKRMIAEKLDEMHAKSSNAICKDNDMCPPQPATFDRFFDEDGTDMHDVDFQDELLDMEEKLRKKFKEDPKAPELNPKAKHVMAAIIKFIHMFLRDEGSEGILQKTLQNLTENGIVIPELKKLKEQLERLGFQLGDRKLVMCAFLYVLEKVLPKKIKPETGKPHVIQLKTEFKKNFDRKKRVFKHQIVKTVTKKKKLMNAEEHIKYYRESLFHIFKKNDPRFEKTMNDDFGVHFYGPLLLETMKEAENM